jgi:hypothetical protein
MSSSQISNAYYMAFANEITKIAKNENKEDKKDMENVENKEDMGKILSNTGTNTLPNKKQSGEKKIKEVKKIIKQRNLINLKK